MLKAHHVRGRSRAKVEAEEIGVAGCVTVTSTFCRYLLQGRITAGAFKRHIETQSALLVWDGTIRV
jgi:hypothetical protein